MASSFWKRWLESAKQCSVFVPARRTRRHSKRTILNVETLEERAVPTAVAAATPFTPGDLAVVQVGSCRGPEVRSATRARPCH